ncbi:lipid A biosynthesis acyltransferase [Glaciecola sp. KUL10]|uniref:LpxL/LpxP family acyltransferase n=1 Tax=Glaciecola sp. (strain KUL10) TaxID=2161813 RepID=UPI000D78BA29|nr:lipid A biosynthesis acyltransferase [Glaciecola sp. KUL10]GBL05898.1 lipid A biosynthesis acyltransferase [Glaciecola sp. KUL10]
MKQGNAATQHGRNICINCLQFVLKQFSRKSRKSFAFFTARFILGFSNATRRRAILNISHVLPNLSYDEATELAFISHQNIVFGVIETLLLDEIEFEYEISQAAQKNLDSNTGLIIATMHMGCYDAVPFALEKLTKRPTIVSKAPTFLSTQRAYEKVGINCYDKNQVSSIFKLIAAIKEQGIVILYSDHYKKDTALSFFGKATGAPYEAAMLSAYGKAPLMIAYGVIQKSGKYKIYLDTVLEKPVGSGKKAHHMATKEIYRRFEQIILGQPKHWYWSFKRKR